MLRSTANYGDEDEIELDNGGQDEISKILCLRGGADAEKERIDSKEENANSNTKSKEEGEGTIKEKKKKRITKKEKKLIEEKEKVRTPFLKKFQDTIFSLISFLHYVIMIFDNKTLFEM